MVHLWNLRARRVAKSNAPSSAGTKSTHSISEEAESTCALVRTRDRHPELRSDCRPCASISASKFYGGENRELLRVVQVAQNIADRIRSGDGEVAIKPGGNGVPK